jgi:uroporphyrinogen-III synthase
MPDALRGLWVVVTRPAHQATHFQQQLEQAGASVLLFPVMAVQAHANTAPAQAILAKLATYDTVIFISSNAVTFGLALLDAQQQQVLQQLTLGAIGKKTANTLRDYGFDAQLVPENGFSSEDFLAMPAVEQLSGQRILIFRGAGGRELLAETLHQRGATVDYADVYQRICPKQDAGRLKQHHECQQLDIIAITSSEGLLNLLALLDNPDWIKAVPLLVGSQRMVATARQAGFTGLIIIADNPGDEAMLQALRQWAQESPR